MKWHYACLSDYPQTANVCLVETPDAYRIMWYSNMDKRWYSDAGEQYSDDDPCNCFKWVYLEDVLEKLKNQKPIEKQKYKADNLLDNGSVKSAIMVYQDILHGERDESVEGKFYGRIYANLGAAYGRVFLYEEAAKMYESAYQICEEKFMLKAYLYACRSYMSSEQYMNLLSRSQMYQDMDAELSEEAKEIAGTIQILQYEDSLSNWKNQYRRISTGEI